MAQRGCIFRSGSRWPSHVLVNPPALSVVVPMEFIERTALARALDFECRAAHDESRAKGIFCRPSSKRIQPFG